MSPNLLTVAALSLALAAPTLASAQEVDGPACETFSLQRAMVGSVFIGSDPAEIGDRRLNRWHYMDEDGNQIGARFIESTVVSVDDPEGDAVIVDVLSVFPNGTIVSRGFTHVPNADVTYVSHDRPAYFAVVGGTGEFTRATGTVTAVPLDDGIYEATYSLTCPE